MLVDEPFDDDGYLDCADEGLVLDGPARVLRAILDAEPNLPGFTSALWRGVVGRGALEHRADALTGFGPEAA